VAVPMVAVAAETVTVPDAVSVPEKVLLPVEAQVQAVLRRFEKAMLVGESPQASRELVPPVQKFLGAVGFERGSGETLKDVFAAVARDCDNPGRFSFERAQPVFLSCGSMFLAAVGPSGLSGSNL
jgi:hypothetical protein